SGGSLRCRHTYYYLAICLSLSPLHLASGEFLDGHQQGLSAAPDRSRRRKVFGFSRGVTAASAAGRVASFGTSLSCHPSLLPRADVADLEPFDPRSLSLYLVDTQDSQSI